MWLILALAAGLRLVAIESRGLQYDDAFSIFLSQQGLGQIISGTSADTMPPLYYFLLHFWMVFGQSVWWLRLLSLLLGLCAVFLTYLWGKDLFGEKAGLWAAFLAAISPLQIYHAQDLRMYALLETAQVGYAFCFTRLYQLEGEDKKSLPWKWWAGLILSGAAALYSHNLAGFVLIVPTLFLIFCRRWRLLAKLLVSQLFLGLLFLPWLVMLPGQIAKIQRAFWTPPPGLAEIIQAVILFHSNLPLPVWALWVVAILSVQIMVLAALETWRDQGVREKLGLLVSFTLLPPLILFGISYLMRPVFVPRGFLMCSLAYYLLVGRVVQRSWPKLGAFLIGAFVLCSLLALPSQYFFNAFPRSPYREAVNYLESVYQPGDGIVHDNKLSYFPAHYYAPNLPQKFIKDQAGSFNDTLAFASQQAMGIYPDETIQTAAGSGSRVYFLVFKQTLVEYQQGGAGDHPALIWLRSQYPQEQKRDFNDLEVYVFSR
jgi:4-amino-4-deoxy-L-arabinose transferase-like glycosyltransferase